MEAMEPGNKNQNLTTAEEVRNQTELVMKPYANWEEYLTPAPLSIAILAELVFISTKKDFSINKNLPKDGYKHIRYPDSFRACLMQVCNSGWAAFNEAQKNMDQIRLHTMSVPDYMNMAIKILFQDSDGIIKAHLPDHLENIRLIADDCLVLANSTEQRFSDVINIIHELLEGCLNAKQCYSDDLDAIQRKLEETKMRKQSSEEAAKRSENVAKSMEEELKKAQRRFNKAMDYKPRTYFFRDVLGYILGSGSASQRESNTAKFRIEQSRDLLNKSREDYEKSLENMENNQKELTEILITMRNCEVKEIDFENTIRMLVIGMDALGRVKAQWEKMVQFFQMVSNIMKICLTRSLKNLLSMSEKTQALSYREKLSSKELLYNQAFLASNIASLVHILSDTYTKVSRRYIIDNVSSLGKLMTMEKEKPEFEFERQQLRSACDEAQKAILLLAQKNRHDHERKSLARLEKFETKLLAILSADAPEELKSSQGAGERRCTEEEEEEEEEEEAESY